MSRPPKYLFEDLDVGMSFDILIADVVPGTVSTLCVRWGKRLGRSFSYTTFADEGVYEVRRNPDPGAYGSRRSRVNRRRTQ